jgi:7-cyano-7-deazaguanine synthase
MWTVLLSGGIDSAAALASAVAEDRSTTAIHVAFGQPAAKEELSAATQIANYYRVNLQVLELAGITTFSDGEIPGRNAFIIHTGILFARGRPTTLVLAIHGGTPYRDCTPEFLDLMRCSVAFHANGVVTLAAPFLEWSKADVYRFAKTMTVPFELTYSCERSAGPCGECGSCADRQLL